MQGLGSTFECAHKEATFFEQCITHAGDLFRVEKIGGTRYIDDIVFS